MGKPAIYDLQSLIAAGIDPKTGLPIRMGSPGQGPYKEAIKKFVRIIDEQDAVNRYKWYNLPANISSQELERMLYYNGQLCLVYLKEYGEFLFAKYALDGGIDFYGRFNRIHPIPVAEGVDDEAVRKQLAIKREYLSQQKFDCIYDVLLPEEWTEEAMSTKCVLLHDYTKQLSQTIIPRVQVQEGIIDIMSDCIPFMRTALLNSTGIQGMRVQSEDEQSNVTAASALINRAAIMGEKYVAIIGAMEFQDLTGGDVSKSEEFLLAMQALDNFRLSGYGIENGGLFEKKAHTLESEQAMNTGNTGIVYNDGLSIRQHFCDICNSLWGTSMWCEASEQAMGIDTSGDGIVMDEEDQSGAAPGEQPEVMANDGN